MHLGDHAPIRHYVEMFTDPHDLVIETHGGAFTTAVACLLTKRRYIGCDVDSECVKNGHLRLREIVHEQRLAEAGRRTVNR
jgi:DNA modification methylase